MRRGAAPYDDGVTAERRELKFVFPAHSVDALRDLLEVNARRVRFGKGNVSRVSSVYFDDHRLTSCAESLSGIARRVKLRLRWYDADLPERSAFFEVKRRLAHVIHKARTRIELPVPLARFAYRELVPGLLPLLDPEAAAMLAIRCQPTTLVSYHREHFHDPESAARLTLDYDIEGFSQLGLRVPSRIARTALDRLAVVEVKVRPGEEGDVRRLLYPLTPRLARCSKYVHCCLADGMGSALALHE